MNNNYKKMIIFDLDGTLLNTSIGVFNSVRYAEKKMGLHPAKEEELVQFLGPPPTEIYQNLYDLNERESIEATEYHREYGSRYAIYEAKLYPGVSETLQSLVDEKIRLAVATLKRKNVAEKMLSLYGIDKYFFYVAGMDAMETCTKADLIRQICAKEKIMTLEDALMVGDSWYDYEGAREAGVEFLGVSYGFGFDSKKPDVMYVDNICEIINFIR